MLKLSGLAKYKKTIIVFGTLAVVCVVSLLAGSSPGEVLKCAISLDPASIECKVLLEDDLTTSPVVIPTPEPGSSPAVIQPVPAS